MPLSPSVRDVEKGIPEAEESRQSLLTADQQSSNVKSLEELQLQDLDPAVADDPLPSSPTEEDKFFIWPNFYLRHSDDVDTEPVSEPPPAENAFIQESEETQELSNAELTTIDNNVEELHTQLTPVNQSKKNDKQSHHKPVKLLNKDIVEKLVEHGAFLICWNDEGQTPLHVCVEKRLENVLKDLIMKVGPDVKDRCGRTVLRAAIDADWLPGVLVALNAGADVAIQAPDGLTPLHAAVTNITNHNKELRETILHEILTVAEQKNVLNCLDAIGETAIFNAVRSGYLSCVRQFLDKGALITHTPKNNLNVFHIAAKCGLEDILQTLLDFDNDSTILMINSLTVPAVGGLAPIHFAVMSNNLACVKILKAKNADICIKTSSNSNESTTPLHMAVDNDNYEIAECILLTNESNKQEMLPIEQYDDKGWLPLHSAIYKGSENFIKLFLKYNANLAAQTQTEKSKTALEMIMKHVTNPTEFLEDLLDSYISLDGCMNRVKIDYSLLMSDRGLKEEMEVIQALLETGNQFKQKRLLLHPLIGSFIYLKWWALSPFYSLILLTYITYVMVLNCFALNLFHYIDTKQKPEWSILLGEGVLIFMLIVFNIVQELLMNVEGRRYFLKRENIFKLGTLALATILPLLILMQEFEAARHVALGALLLACIQFLNITSQSEYLGYYVVMFKKVTWNISKILITFFVLMYNLACCFKILFRSQYPFDSQWHSIVKTMFLMTAEFEYNETFKRKNAERLGFSIEIIRALFLIFLIMIAIVLMNMMVGVAVDDITDLKAHGKMGMLEKQSAFVRSLDTLKYNLTKVIVPRKYRRTPFPIKITFEKTTINEKIFINIHKLPKRFRDAFFNIAQKNKDKDQEMVNKNNELEEERKRNDRQCNFYGKTMDRLDALEKVTAKNASQIDNINSKLDVLKVECLEIKQLLMNLKVNQDKEVGG